jgi:hypothetical protein
MSQGSVVRRFSAIREQPIGQYRTLYHASQTSLEPTGPPVALFSLNQLKVETVPPIDIHSCGSAVDFESVVVIIAMKTKERLHGAVT